MTSSIVNERTKLAANALDRASTVCLAVGMLAPLATLLQGQARPPVMGVSSFRGWLSPLSCYILPQGGCSEVEAVTIGWVIFGIGMPAVVAGLGWIAVLANEHSLRKHEERRTKPAE